ncbi:hypothetical protein HK102_004202, partial [Quaeritorhiza haematococci]
MRTLIPNKKNHLKGDIRAENWFLSGLSRWPPLLSDSGDGSLKAIDAIYFDSTFCEDQYEFLPTKNESVEEILKFIDSQPKSTNFQIEGCSDLGTEHIIIAIAQRFDAKVTSSAPSSSEFGAADNAANSRVYVTERQYDLYASFSSVPEEEAGFLLPPGLTADITQYLTTKRNETRFHACRFPKEEYDEMTRRKALIIMKATAKWWNCNRLRVNNRSRYRFIRQKENWVNVVYSIHSSLGEVQQLMRIFRPRKIYPCVGSLEGGQLQRYFGKYIDSSSPLVHRHRNVWDGIQEPHPANSTSPKESPASPSPSSLPPHSFSKVKSKEDLVWETLMSSPRSLAPPTEDEKGRNADGYITDATVCEGDEEEGGTPLESTVEVDTKMTGAGTTATWCDDDEEDAAYGEGSLCESPATVSIGSSPQWNPRNGVNLARSADTESPTVWRSLVDEGVVADGELSSATRDDRPSPVSPTEVVSTTWLRVRRDAAKQQSSLVGDSDNQSDAAEAHHKLSPSASNAESVGREISESCESVSHPTQERPRQPSRSVSKELLWSDLGRRPKRRRGHVSNKKERENDSQSHSINARKDAKENTVVLGTPPRKRRKNPGSDTTTPSSASPIVVDDDDNDGQREKEEHTDIEEDADSHNHSSGFDDDGTERRSRGRSREQECRRTAPSKIEVVVIDSDSDQLVEGDDTEGTCNTDICAKGSKSLSIPRAVQPPDLLDQNEESMRPSPVHLSPVFSLTAQTSSQSLSFDDPLSAWSEESFDFGEDLLLNLAGSRIAVKEEEVRAEGLRVGRRGSTPQGEGFRAGSDDEMDCGSAKSLAMSRPFGERNTESGAKEAGDRPIPGVRDSNETTVEANMMNVDWNRVEEIRRKWVAGGRGPRI